MRGVIVFATLWLVTFACIAEKQQVVFLAHDIPPFSFVKNNELQGAAIELLAAMKEVQNLAKVETKVFPFKRAMYTVEQRGNYALLVVAKRPERESRYKWVGPLFHNQVFFYQNRTNPQDIDHLSDIKSNSAIAVGLGNADDEYLSSLGFKNLSRNMSQQDSLILLQKKLVDLTVMGEMTFYGINKYGAFNNVDITRTNVKLYDSSLYIVFSKTVSDQTIAQWQNALDSIKSTPVFTNVMEKYFPAELRNQK